MASLRFLQSLPPTYNPPVSSIAHRKDAPACVRCYVLTISDTRTPETDTSGDAIVLALKTAGHEVVGRQIVRDDPAGVRDAVKTQAGNAQVIVTTGGTGITARDSTYEAIASLLEKKPKMVYNHIGRAYGILANAHSISSKEKIGRAHV